jgi:hypothetical protein
MEVGLRYSEVRYLRTPNLKFQISSHISLIQYCIFTMKNKTVQYLTLSAPYLDVTANRTDKTLRSKPKFSYRILLME